MCLWAHVCEHTFVSTQNWMILQNAEKIGPFRTISVDVRIRTVAFECCILFEKCLYGTRAKYAQHLAPKHFTTQGTHVNSYDLCTFANAPQNKYLPIMHTLDHHMTEFCLWMLMKLCPSHHVTNCPEFDAYLDGQIILIAHWQRTQGEICDSLKNVGCMVPLWTSFMCKRTQPYRIFVVLS